MSNLSLKKKKTYKLAKEKEVDEIREKGKVTRKSSSVVRWEGGSVTCSVRDHLHSKDLPQARTGHSHRSGPGGPKGSHVLNFSSDVLSLFIKTHMVKK